MMLSQGYAKARTFWCGFDLFLKYEHEIILLEGKSSMNDRAHGIFFTLDLQTTFEVIILSNFTH